MIGPEWAPIPDETNVAGYIRTTGPPWQQRCPSQLPMSCGRLPVVPTTMQGSALPPAYIQRREVTVLHCGFPGCVKNAGEDARQKTTAKTPLKRCGSAFAANGEARVVGPVWGRCNFGLRTEIPSWNPRSGWSRFV